MKTTAMTLVTSLLFALVLALAARPTHAEAPAPSCKQWIVVTKTASGLQAVKGDDFARAAPAGWEPFGLGMSPSTGAPLFALRKCAD